MRFAFAFPREVTPLRDLVEYYRDADRELYAAYVIAYGEAKDTGGYDEKITSRARLALDELEAHREAALTIGLGEYTTGIEGSTKKRFKYFEPFELTGKFFNSFGNKV